MDQYTTQCPNCYAPSVLNRVGMTRAGAPIYRCVACGRDAVAHSSPSHRGVGLWLPVLEAGVTQVCPTCGIVEEVTTIVARSPYAPPALRYLAQCVATGALIVGTIILVGAVVKSVREAA